ncbi:hypothetical protein [Bosea sp. PAMC 26642]|uniref:hypothetical protein n=1 Tax=Bosea sp. (strain PAMC 26642) TaxID=1792307 RepID=UPI0007700642|nr:hypothetical protein [Bosea sp. PAMC 26642]AMJ63035.1 hypothetical protein AXW83_24490 [Bosea sp. PAMC 26642]
MLNAHVGAAATGLPKSSRRAFLASAAALSATLPAAVAAAAPADDPIFAAISAWREADATWLAKLDKHCEAENACAAENALMDPCLQIELCGVPFSFKSNAEITYFLRNLPNRGASATENVERMEAAEQRLREALEAERQRVEMVRSKHDLDALEAHHETASDAARIALGRVVETVPTTLAGIRTLAELMADPDLFYTGQSETGLASLAAACRALLPAA